MDTKLFTEMTHVVVIVVCMKTCLFRVSIQLVSEEVNAK